MSREVWEAVQANRVAPRVCDMVGVDRSLGYAVYSHRCPKCGRYAHTLRGNDGSGRYWMDTRCKKCGDWRVTGHPLPWWPSHKSRKLEGPLTFDEIPDTYDEY